MERKSAASRGPSRPPAAARSLSLIRGRTARASCPARYHGPLSIDIALNPGEEVRERVDYRPHHLEQEAKASACEDGQRDQRDQYRRAVRLQLRERLGEIAWKDADRHLEPIQRCD